MSKSGRERKARRKLRDERTAMTPEITMPTTEGSGGPGEVQMLDGRRSTNVDIAHLLGLGVVPPEQVRALLKHGHILAAKAARSEDTRNYTSAMRVVLSAAKIEQAERHHRDRLERGTDGGFHIHGDVITNNLLNADPDRRTEDLLAIAAEATAKRLAGDAGRRDGSGDSPGTDGASDTEAEG